MRPTNRFQKSRADVGAKLLDGATGMKLTLWRDDDGDLSGGFEVTGSLGDEDQGDALELVRELLADFSEKRD